jgi:dodecin
MVEKTIDLTGTSAIGIEDAVNLAVKRASVTVQKIRQAKVVEAVALVEDDAVTRWRVRVEVTFVVQDQMHE